MNWTGRKVLVTGAGGFIGSHLAERLIELGACVRSSTTTGRAGAVGSTLPTRRRKWRLWRVILQIRGS